MRSTLVQNHLVFDIKIILTSRNLSVFKGLQFELNHAENL
jgi:hypothetical protein